MIGDMMFEIVKNCQIDRKILLTIYNEFLVGKTNGILVEVGAFDGINYSNTYGLLKAGWKGILIEPDPISIEKLNQNLSGLDYKLLPYAVASKNLGKIRLFQNEAFSSVLPNRRRKSKGILVETRTLDALLVDLETYDMFNLDVEGYEIEVLKGYNILKHNPKVAIVETHDKTKNPKLRRDGIKEFCDSYFAKSNYEKWWSDAINTVYVLKG